MVIEAFLLFINALVNLNSPATSDANEKGITKTEIQSKSTKDPKQLQDAPIFHRGGWDGN